MSFILKPLPYDAGALEPIMSARTLELHHGKHHAGYVAKLNQLVAGSSLEDADLESIVRATAVRPKQHTTYTNAAQVWNHDFFWSSLAPGGAAPPESVRQRIVANFQSMENFSQRFLDVAARHFGSGWVWLVLNGGKLEIVATHDADSPLTMNVFPLMTCDVWEHAYYLDYQNRRADYVKAVLDKLVNWRHVAMQLAEAERRAVRQRRDSSHHASA